MPTYTMKNVETGEVTTELMPISAMEERIAGGKFTMSFEGVKNAPALVRGNPKPDHGFREVLRSIKRGNPGSVVNTWD